MVAFSQCTEATCWQMQDGKRCGDPWRDSRLSFKSGPTSPVGHSAFQQFRRVDLFTPTEASPQRGHHCRHQGAPTERDTNASLCGRASVSMLSGSQVHVSVVEGRTSGESRSDGEGLSLPCGICHSGVEAAYGWGINRCGMSALDLNKQQFSICHFSRSLAWNAIKFKTSASHLRTNTSCRAIQDLSQPVLGPSWAQLICSRVMAFRRTPDGRVRVPR